MVANECPATREAVIAAEGWGGFTCDICGGPAETHRSEDFDVLDHQQKVAVPHGGQIIAEGHGEMTEAERLRDDLEAERVVWNDRLERLKAERDGHMLQHLDALAKVKRLEQHLDQEAREHQVTYERWMAVREAGTRLYQLLDDTGLGNTPTYDEVDAALDDWKKANEQ